jgi:hypothetical protein
MISTARFTESDDRVSQVIVSCGELNSRPMHAAQPRGEVACGHCAPGGQTGGGLSYELYSQS